MIKVFRIVFICAVAALVLPSGALAQSCAAGPATVQILGSGGPAINRERASASYLLWVGGQAKMLVDMGGGTYLRFGQSGAKLSDLALAGISHLHPDHVSDLPALLWLSRQLRTEPLPIVGPSGNDVAPDFPTFLARLFDEKNGAFQVLGATLGAARGNGVRLDVSVVDVAKAEPAIVFKGPDLTVTAMGIPHANMPTSPIGSKRRPDRWSSVPTRTAQIRNSSTSRGTPMCWLCTSPSRPAPRALFTPRPRLWGASPGRPASGV